MGHGLFTYVLLRGLKEKKADLNGDGVITVKELSSYAYLNFETESRRVMGKDYIQSPVVLSLGRDDLSSRVLDFPLVSIK